MRGNRMVRGLQLAASGMFILQIGGCTTTQFLEFVQTILLGITAAGGIAIIQNI